MEFEPISTQEEFEERLADRLAQKERSVSKKFEGYTSPGELEKIRADYEEKISGLEEKVKSYSDVDAKISGYEEKIAKYESDSVKTRIAVQKGLPYALIDRIRGTTEEEITNDVDSLLELVTQKQTAPLASETRVTDGDMEKAKLDSAYREMLKKL